MFKNSASLSIARRIQFQIGLVIAVVIVGVTLLAYQNSIRSMREEALDSLFASITQRSNHDSAAFVDAQQNTYQLRNEYLRRLALMGNQDPKAEFDAWFTRYPDGLIRVRPERDDHKHLPSIYIRSAVNVTPAIRRQVVAAFGLLREWGPIMTLRYYSAYIDLPGIALIMYSPSVNWGKDADKTTNNFDYPPVKNSSPFNNPLRQNLWTEVYWDDKALIYMVSTITPADQAGEWVGTVSQDLSVDELVKSTITNQIPGTYNLLISDDGRLIAHPERMEEISKAGGNLNVKSLKDPLLNNITDIALQAGMYPEVRESADGQNYLGMSRIRGPNWHLVTVYPKALLQARAYGSAQVILLGGLVGLVVELALLAWIIRRQVALPLGRLSQAAASIAKGDLQVELDDREGHELGRLARNFLHMASRLRERDEALTNRARELEHEVSERISSEHRMQHMATHDALTGLANRTLLMDRLQQALVAGARNQQVIAVLFIDLDNFKQINDTLGHDAGDDVLRHVGAKVSLLLRKSDTLSRMGGDEFVLLLPAIGRKEDAMVIAEKIIASLSETIEVGGVNFAITPSIGISSFPSDGDDAQTLLKNADIAMYRAKEYGRNGFQCYTPDMGQRASEVLPMEVAIRSALANDEFELYFQPKVDARSQAIVSSEALLRWSRPGFGLLSPGAFIPFAEERANLMRAIDGYVLRKACVHLARWRSSGVPLKPIAVNLSASQFARAGMIAELEDLLAEFCLDGKLLTLEVTEGVLLAEGGVAADNMAALRRMGVQVSIDDFGTGFSSLSYLHRFPVDELKIDRSFVSKIGRTDKDAALVKAIIGLGRDLSLRVVAEGVETADQADYLARNGCDVLQGYLFYLPMSEENFLEMLGAQAFASV